MSSITPLPETTSTPTRSSPMTTSASISLAAVKMGSVLRPTISGDADNGPNQLQNYPVLTFANSAAVIQGSLNSVANKPYRIDFFSSPAADRFRFRRGPDMDRLGECHYRRQRQRDIQQDFPGSLTPGSVVTATATGTGTGASGTSEFSAAITVVP